MKAHIRFIPIIWIIMMGILLNGCSNNKERRTTKMPNLGVQDLRDRNIPINLVQYRNLREDDPTQVADWKIVIFSEEVGFGKDDIVLVENSFYIPDGDTLIHICEVSDQQTTDERIIPYLKRKIDRSTLLK